MLCLRRKTRHIDFGTDVSTFTHFSTVWPFFVRVVRGSNHHHAVMAGWLACITDEEKAGSRLIVSPRVAAAILCSGWVGVSRSLFCLSSLCINVAV